MFLFVGFRVFNLFCFFFFLMIRRPPRSTLFPTRRSSDLLTAASCVYLMEPQWNPTIEEQALARDGRDRKSTRLNSSHSSISYAVFCLKKKKKKKNKNLKKKKKKKTKK